jgi:hypothetical protein
MNNYKWHLAKQNYKLNNLHKNTVKLPTFTNVEGGSLDLKNDDRFKVNIAPIQVKTGESMSFATGNNYLSDALPTGKAGRRKKSGGSFKF